MRGIGSISLPVPIPPKQGGTGTSTQFTPKSIPYADANGNYAQDNANLQWDESQDQLTAKNLVANSGLFVASGNVNQSYGGLSLNYTPINDANYTAFIYDCIIAYTALSAGRTLTLPTSVGKAGQIYIIKDQAGNAGTNNITIATTSSQTIDGAATKVINSNFGIVRIYSNNVNWFTW